MDRAAIDIYRCPFCHTSVNSVGKMSSRVLTNAALVCGTGRHHFAVVSGRPIFLHPAQFNRWTAPISEALGLDTPESMEDSFRRLADMGLKRAIKRVNERKKPKIVGNIGAGALKVFRSKTIMGKARYRTSGEWFRHRNRMRFKELGQPLEKIEKGTEAKMIAWRLALQIKPRRYIDMASGPGNFLIPVVHNATNLEFAAATERDLKCLWSLQYRLDNVRHAGIAEAVGADVRNLPFPDGFFDLATINVSLAEIQGISMALSEAHRVLFPDGSLIVVNHERIFETDCYDKTLVDALSINALERFAAAADIIFSYGQFEKLCKQSGFKKIKTRFIDSAHGRLFVSRLQK